MKPNLNLLNYALMLEKRAYLVESVNLSEGKDDPTEQTEAGLKNVMDGQNQGNQYADRWNQLIADYQKNKAKAGTHTVIIRDESGQALVKLQYGVGKDGKPVKDSVKLAVDAAASKPTGSLTLDANKFSSFNANGKLHEVISAMIQVCIEKLGTDWGENHVKWVNEQLARAANINTSCMGLVTPITTSSGEQTTPPATSKHATFLKQGAAVFSAIAAANDAPIQIVNNKSKLMNAGDAKTPELLDVVIAAIKSKLDETIVVQADEICLVNCYFLISPKLTQDQIEAAWQKLGFGKGGPFSAIVAELDQEKLEHGKMLAVWALGSRLGKANADAVTACGLDVNSHNLAVKAIQGSLISV